MKPGSQPMELETPSTQLLKEELNTFVLCFLLLQSSSDANVVISYVLKLYYLIELECFMIAFLFLQCHKITQTAK